MDVKALRSSSFLIPPRQYDTNAKEAMVETLLQGNAATPVRHSRVMVMSTKEGWCRFNVVHCWFPYSCPLVDLDLYSLGVTSQEDSFLCEDSPYGRWPITIRCGATPEHLLPKASLFDWSLSPSPPKSCDAWQQSSCCARPETRKETMTDNSLLRFSMEHGATQRVTTLARTTRIVRQKWWTESIWWFVQEHSKKRKPCLFLFQEHCQWWVLTRFCSQIVAQDIYHLKVLSLWTEHD